MAIKLFIGSKAVSLQEAAKAVIVAPPPAPPAVKAPETSPQPCPPVPAPKAKKEGISLKKMLTPTDNAAPWDAPADYGLLQALKDHYDNKFPGRVLQINALNNPSTYIVESYNPVTGESVLKGPHGMILKPRITSREEGKYLPFWR